jgi:YbbR domain-containing protein
MNVREMLTHNIGLKALSLFLAMMLWLFVAAGMESEIALFMPVVFAHLSPGLAIVNQPPARIDVRLAGPRILLLKLKAERLPVFLDLQGVREGITAFPAVEMAIHIPEGVRVTRVTPAAIEVRLAKIGTPGTGEK